MSRGVKFLCLLGLILLSVSCSPTVIKIDKGVDEEIEETLPPEPTATAEPTPTPGLVDCVEDLACFFNRLEGCQEATLLYSQGLNMMGAEIETTLLLTVLGPEQDLCQFSLVTDQISITISEEAVQQLLAAGKTEEEIEAQRLMLEQSQESVRFDEICTGDPADLIAVLERWEQGQISLNDWEPFSCEGKIFSALTTQPEPTEEPPAEVEVSPPPGGSILANPSFEADPGITPPAWYVDERGSNLIAEWSSEISMTGGHSLLLGTTNTANKGYPGWFLVEPITIEQPAWNILQVWAFTPDGADAFLSVEYLDGDGGTINSSGLGCIDLESNSWNKLEYGILESRLEGVNAIRLGLGQCTKETEGTLTHLYYDDIYFGTTPP